MAIQKIDDIYELLKGNTQKKRLVVAYANDSHSIEAVNKAVEMGIVEATLCGDENEIRKVNRAGKYLHSFHIGGYACRTQTGVLRA